MKKSYLALGLVAAVAMSSCSNDEPLVNPNQQNPAKDLVPVELGLTSASADVNVGTRGTGTVGGMDVASNKWQYEDIYVLMTSTDTTSLEAEDFTVDGVKQPEGWGFTSVKGHGPFLKQQFNGTFWTRPESESSSVRGTNLNYFIDKNEWWNDAPISKYYPMYGESEFFAYHVDDAYDKSNEAAYRHMDLYVTDNAGNSQTGAHKYPIITKENNQMSIQYMIDGTQDLMFGHDDNGGEGYSAKTARAGKVPSITMQHLLTRLTFNVIKGAESTNMVRLNGIRVKSKNQGKMFVAYAPAPESKPENILVWNEEAEDATFSLMQYKSTVKVEGTNCVDADGYEIEVEAYFPTTIADPETGEETTSEELVKCPLLYMETSNGMDFRFTHDGKFYPLSSPNLKEGSAAEAMEKVVRETPPAASLANGKSTLVDFEPIALSTIANVGDNLNVGEAMFIKPGVTELAMELDLTMTVRNQNEVFDGVEDPYTSTQLEEELDLPLTIKTPANMTFEAGKSYQINITVYGLEKVKIYVVPEAWENGGEVNIGGDNDAEFGTWFDAEGNELDANGEVVVPEDDEEDPVNPTPGENGENEPGTGEDDENN